MIPLNDLIESLWLEGLNTYEIARVVSRETEVKMAEPDVCRMLDAIRVHRRTFLTSPAKLASKHEGA